MSLFLIILLLILLPIIAYLSYVLGYLGGLSKGILIERPEPILEAQEAFKKPFERHQFAIIPSRREKKELKEEEADNFKPGNLERFLK